MIDLRGVPRWFLYIAGSVILSASAACVSMLLGVAAWQEIEYRRGLVDRLERIELRLDTHNKDTDKVNSRLAALEEWKAAHERFHSH